MACRYSRRTRILGWMLEAEVGEPPGMDLSPGPGAAVDLPVAQQKGLQMLALGAQIRHRGLTGPHQLPHGLMPRVGHPDPGEFAGAMQPGQGEGIPAIGLDALARPLRDQRGSDDGAVMPEGADLPLQPIAGRPGLVAEQQPPILAGELGDQPPHRLWRMVDVAQEAHLTVAPLFGQGYRDLHLGSVETDKDCAILLHGSSPMREARHRPIRRNPRSPHSAGRATSASATNIRSATCIPDVFLWPRSPPVAGFLFG